jgi:uncharacterized protein YkwD
MIDLPIKKTIGHVALLGLFAVALAACSPSVSTMAPLSSGLTARMDAPGASLNRAEAIGIVNAYRSTTGTVALAADASLDSSAQALAAQYASTGAPPSAPAGVTAIKLSAGYATFAETFSGWRNSPADAAVLTNGTARRGGIGVAYNANSNYGVYWVLLLDD